MSEPNTVELRLEEGTYAQGRINAIVERGQIFLSTSHLLSTTKSVDETDTRKFREFIELVVPMDETNGRVLPHLDLVAKFDRKITEQLLINQPDLSSQLIVTRGELLGYLHDFGRFITHRFQRNDALSNHILKKIGVREDLLTSLPSIRKFMDKTDTEEEAQKIFDQLTPEQRVIEIADMCGKRKPDGGIPTFEEVMSYHNIKKSREDYEKQTKLSMIWPSEIKLEDPNFVKLSVRVYEKEIAWLHGLGVDVETVRQQILSDEQGKL